MIKPREFFSLPRKKWSKIFLRRLSEEYRRNMTGNLAKLKVNCPFFCANMKSKVKIFRRKITNDVECYITMIESSLNDLHLSPLYTLKKDVIPPWFNFQQGAVFLLESVLPSSYSSFSRKIVMKINPS